MKQTILFALMLLGLCSACSTNQTTAAYKAETATDLSVTTALAGWNVYVANYHPTPAVEQQVYNAWLLYKSSELALVDATEAIVNSPTNTAPAVQAQNAVAAAQLDLLNIISAITNAVPIK